MPPHVTGQMHHGLEMQIPTRGISAVYNDPECLPFKKNHDAPAGFSLWSFSNVQNMLPSRSGDSRLSIDRNFSAYLEAAEGLFSADNWLEIIFSCFPGLSREVCGQNCACKAGQGGKPNPSFQVTEKAYHSAWRSSSGTGDLLCVCLWNWEISRGTAGVWETPQF